MSIIFSNGGSDMSVLSTLSPVLLLSVFVSTALLSGQSPRLLADINKLAPPNPSSLPHDFVGMGSRIFFVAQEAEDGGELFVVDQQGGAAVRLTDIDPNAYPVFVARYPATLTPFGAKLLFTTTSSVSDIRDLWLSDGSPSGTVQLVAGPATSILGELGAVALFFRGRDLWKTDGTVVGTVLLRAGVKLQSFPSREPMQSARLGAHLYFAGHDGVGGSELWRSDGTSAGTQKFVDLYGVTSANPSGFLTLGTELLFTALSPAASRELWRSDGTVAGTLRVHTTGGTPLGIVGNQVLYRGADTSKGEELWSTDGSTAGTALVLDINPGPVSSFPYLAASNGLRLFFLAQTAADGYELWSSDGTAAGTRRATDMGPGQVDAEITSIAVSPAAAFFVRRPTPALRDFELWRSDGTQAGTSRLRSGLEGAHSVPYQTFSVTVAGTQVYYQEGGAHGIEPWTSDGTPAGSRLLADVNRLPPGTTESSLVRTAKKMVYGVSPDHVLMVLDDGIHGAELWRTDGASSNTVMLKDMTPGPSGTVVSDIQSFEDAVYVAVEGAAPALWKSDGTTAGTAVLVSAASSPPFSAPVSISPVSLGSLHFFFSGGPGNGDQLWRTDGSPGGSVRLATGINSDFDGVLLGDTFYVTDAAGGVTATDGSLAGTRKVLSLSGITQFVAKIWGDILVSNQSGGATTYHLVGRPAASPPVPGGELFAVGDLLFGLEPNKLSVGDGTSLRLVAQFVDTLTSAIGLDGSLLFFADDGQSGMELWRSDGTVAGTGLLMDLAPGATGSMALWHFSRIGTEVIFWVMGSTQTYLPWVTNGTSAGTRLVGANQGSSLMPMFDEMPIATSHGLYGLLGRGSSFGSVIYEPWLTDGTAAGSHLLGRRPGQSSITMEVESAIVLGGKVLFFGNDDLRGAEPWVADMGALHQVIGSPCAAAAEPVLLRTSIPRIGRTLDIEVLNIPQGTAGVIFVGDVAHSPLALRPGCFVHLDLASLGVFALVPPVMNGTWTQQLPVPNAMELRGLSVIMRPFVGPSMHALGGDLGAPVLLTFGS